MPIFNSLSQSKLSPTQIYEMERKMEADITEGLWEVRKRIITDVVNSYSDRLLDMQTFHELAIEIGSTLDNRGVGDVEREMDAVYCFLGRIFKDRLPVSRYMTVPGVEALKKLIGPYWKVDFITE